MYDILHRNEIYAIECSLVIDLRHMVYKTSRVGSQLALAMLIDGLILLSVLIPLRAAGRQE